ncbi:MAG: MarR family transcriptional regulator [Acidimicrobiia bacterium]|nr:MarR family transcriptional regulator [Acidimicrobiia bacterium]
MDVADPMDDADLAAIERALIILVRRADHPRSHARLERRAGVSLERTSYVVLARVHDGESLRLSDLASGLGVDLSTASRQVARLAELGLVARDDDPADRRAAALRVTRRGRDILRRLRAARRERLGELLAGWTARDRAELARLLGSFADILVASADEEALVAGGRDPAGGRALSGPPAT